MGSKKVLSLILAAGMLLGMTACGGGGDAAPQNTGTESADAGAENSAGACGGDNSVL